MSRFRDDLPSAVALLVTIAAVLLTFGAIVSVFAPELTADDSSPAETEHDGSSVNQANETAADREANETAAERERVGSTDAETDSGDTAAGGGDATPTPESEGDGPAAELGSPSDDTPERPDPESELGGIERTIEQALGDDGEDEAAERDSGPFDDERGRSDDDGRGRPDSAGPPGDS
ncbi:hypothetical protein [Natrinema caseinilyticum]|uniref:hypothetical protein n=1 Tax=Natrinema caseinilyticum TaxID=2961570 RepID=UPI0020C2C5A3|nr:hypothetical protein [Natrinema caseinilyticum]